MWWRAVGLTLLVLVGLATLIFVWFLLELPIEEDPPQRRNPLPPISPSIKEQLRGRGVPGLGTLSNGRCRYKGRLNYTGGPFVCKVGTVNGRKGICRVRLNESEEVSSLSCRRASDEAADQAISGPSVLLPYEPE
jgi:hypothetical protein